MKYAKVYSAQPVGLMAEIISIETDITNGLHSFSIVGLGDKAVNESRDRVAAAIKNSGFVSPKQKNQKVIINLAPAQTKKEGSYFDLGIAISYLIASGHITPCEKTVFVGELTLEGRVQPIHGILQIIRHAYALGIHTIYIPEENRDEASLLLKNNSQIRIFPVQNLLQLIDSLKGIRHISYLENTDSIERKKWIPLIDMNQIRGNKTAKRALEIAAVGRHNILLSGPPGVGKTLLARAFVDILPDLTYEESIDVGIIHSTEYCGVYERPITRPPLRSPHHTASFTAIVGGGPSLSPGEITRAHHGVLFLDELPEFDRRAIEALRQPLEEKCIQINRLKGSISYPADCILIAAMNPCPCAYGDDRCQCGETLRKKYRSKISSALLDRIDIHLNISTASEIELSEDSACIESSETIRARIIHARIFHTQRTCTEKEMFTESTQLFLSSIVSKLRLSTRAYDHIISVATSIADIAGSIHIEKEHLLEALQYRRQI